MWGAFPRYMDDVLVGSLMTSPVRTVRPAETARNAAEMMVDHDISSVVVVDEENHPEGILTSTDYVHIAADDATAGETPVSTYMTGQVTTATVNDRVADVAEVMMGEDVHHLPVVDNTEGVVGMITTKDFAAYLSEARAPSPPGTDD
jgi:CBS domain-containing protein